MSPIACLYTVALLFIISVMASRNNVFLQRDLGLFFFFLKYAYKASKIIGGCLKMGQVHFSAFASLQKN